MSPTFSDTAHPQEEKPPRRKNALRIAIAGSGCTGLRIAHLLSRWQSDRPDIRALHVTLYEPRARSGGLIGTERHASGLKIEAAAQGVLASRTVFLQTLEDLGLSPVDIITPQTDRRQQTRYIIAPSGRMAALGGPLSLLASGLLSLPALFRALSEFFRPAQQLPLPNETLFAFIERRFGKVIAENFILPLTTGIWGGGAEKILARHAFPSLVELELKYGGILRGLLLKKFSGSPDRMLSPAQSLKHRWPAGLLSFAGGMQTLIESFENNLRTWAYSNPAGSIEFKYSTPVTSIEKRSGGTFLLNGKDEYDAVFWTAAPWQSASLDWHKPEIQSEWNKLQSVPVHSLIVVNVSAPKDRRCKNGFGVLARRESDGLLGVLFVHSIYPQHVPEGTASYRVLLGGDRCPEMKGWSDGQIADYAISSLIRLELIEESQKNAQNISIIRWPDAICLADSGHDERQKSLWRIQAHCQGIYFGGIYRKGVGVADALQSAQDCFEEWKANVRP